MSFAEDQEELKKTSFWKSQTVISEQPYRVLLEAPDPEPQPEPPPERVGCGHPPRQHRFKPGQSGNPKGRPMGSKNKLAPHWGDKLADIIEGGLFRTISVREGDKQISMPAVQGVVRAATVTGIKGSTRAQKLVLETAIEWGRIQTARQQEHLLLGLEYKYKAEAEIQDRLRRGITDISDILPHPDDMVIDPVADTIWVNGPETAEQKKEWDGWVAERRTRERVIANLREMMATTRGRKQKQALQDMIAGLEADLAENIRIRPDWKIRE